jgi:hypothetical protein
MAPETSRPRSGRRRFLPTVEQLEGRTVPSVTYHGGAVLADVGVEALFLGSAWQTDPSLAPLAAQLGGYLQVLTGGSFMDALSRSGYGVGRGSYLDSGTDAMPMWWIISDAQIQQEIAASISNGTLQAPDANRLYVVYVQPGVAVTSPFGESTFGVLGYHSDFQGPTGTPVSYAVLPFPSENNSFIPGLNPFETLTAVTSHELAESVTDPYGDNVGRPAWYDNTWRDPVSGAQGAEIGDMTENVFIDWGGYVLQGVVNRRRQLLVPVGGSLDARSSGLHHRGGANHASHTRPTQRRDTWIIHADPIQRIVVHLVDTGED